MFVSGAQLCTIVLVLAAAVNARPGLGGLNDINVASKPDPAVSGKAAEVVPKTTTEKLITAEVSKPVNEKYPHALLFKGTCGGTIISSTWVLTAAHCTLSHGRRTVLAGTNNTENGTGISRRVKRLVIHPLFSVGPYWLNAYSYNIKQVAARWDFMLAELAEPLPLDGKTMVAATLNEEVNLPAGLDVGYAGYGTKYHGGTMHSDMHGMELSIQNDESCKILEQYNPEDMLCAKGRPPRFDAGCDGDSGSGLVDNNGRLVGVMSWGEDDARECRDGSLVVFSRVSAVRDWIRQVTNI